MDYFDYLAAAAQAYPSIAPLFSHADVANVMVQVMQAEQNGQPMTPDQIDALLKNTAYYQQTPDAERAFQIGMAINPATYQQKLNDTGQQFYALEDQLGVLRGQLMPDLVQRAAAEGWDTQRMKYEILAAGVAAGGAIGANVPTLTGELGADATQIHQIAQQYAVPISNQEIMNWAVQMGQGRIDQTGITGYMQEQAKSLYPSLANEISQGITVQQYADPYKQLAVQELNINPSDFDLTDPKWAAALQQIDPKTGARTALSLQSWQQKLRTDPTYGYDSTNGARDQAAQLTTKIAQEFGAM